jgi:hypothetical protein
MADRSPTTNVTVNTFLKAIFRHVLQLNIYLTFKHPVYYSTGRHLQYFLNLNTAQRIFNTWPPLQENVPVLRKYQQLPKPVLNIFPPLPCIWISKAGKPRISVHHNHRSQLLFLLWYLADFNFTWAHLIKWKSLIHTYKKATNYSANYSRHASNAFCIHTY